MKLAHDLDVPFIVQFTDKIYKTLYIEMSNVKKIFYKQSIHLRKLY